MKYGYARADVSRRALRALLFWATFGISHSKGGSYFWLKDDLRDIAKTNGMKVRKPYWKDEPHMRQKR